MNIRLIQFGVIVGLLGFITACAVVPAQPIGYRSTTTTVVPSYTGDQYVTDGYDYAPNYVPNTTTVVQTTPVYPPYTPYYSPVYVDPLVGFGLGLGLGVVLSKGGHGGSHWHGGGGWRGGRRR